MADAVFTIKSCHSVLVKAVPLSDTSISGVPNVEEMNDEGKKSLNERRMQYTNPNIRNAAQNANMFNIFLRDVLSLLRRSGMLTGEQFIKQLDHQCINIKIGV